MTQRYLGLIALLLLLTACSGLGPRQQGTPGPATDTDRTESVPTNAELAVQDAQELADSGQWADAIALLDSAAQSFPNDATLVEEHESLVERWAYEQRVIEDEILVNDAEGLREKLALLEKLARAEPGDLVVASRRAYWNQALTGKLDELVACCDAHVSTQPALARRCLSVASEMSAPREISRRLARIEEKLRKTEERVAQRQRVAAEKEDQARVTHLLEKARLALGAREYRRALDTLRQVARLEPRNPEMLKLRRRIERVIRPQIEALVKRGDQLYLDEQLDAAVATWRAALNLRPQDEEILARIERAQTVLSKLKELRREQNKSGTVGK